MVSIETAIAVPVVMIFFLGMVVFGHALYVRYHLAHGANEVARACGMASATPEVCEEYAQWHLADVARWCSPLDVDVDSGPLSGLDGVNVMAVQLRCGYSGGIAHATLGRVGITFGSLEAQALVPY